MEIARYWRLQGQRYNLIRRPWLSSKTRVIPEVEAETENMRKADPDKVPALLLFREVVDCLENLEAHPNVEIIFLNDDIKPRKKVLENR